MNDLQIAISIMLALCALAGWLAANLLYSSRGQATILALAVSVLAMFYFLYYGNGQLIWARFVPSSAAIIYTNLASLFAAAGAGWAWRLPNTPTWRRAGLCAMMSCACLTAIFWPLLSIALRPPPVGGDDWQRGVALQTSWATCSPAAAATLLHAEGIEVSERQLIPLCLTDNSGTPTLGLYRGLKLVANQHARQVQLVPSSLKELIDDDDWPVLIAVELPYGVEDRRYVEQWGWIPGLGHSVVVLDRTPDDKFLIGDPSAGLELWSRADLELLWHGNGIRIR